jgi:hypothetical protein
MVGAAWTVGRVPGWGGSALQFAVTISVAVQASSGSPTRLIA